MLPAVLAVVCSAAIALNCLAIYEILTEDSLSPKVVAGWVAAVTLIPLVGAVAWLRWCSPMVLARWPHLRAPGSVRPTAAEVHDLHDGMTRLLEKPLAPRPLIDDRDSREGEREPPAHER